MYLSVSKNSAYIKFYCLKFSPALNDPKKVETPLNKTTYQSLGII